MYLCRCKKDLIMCKVSVNVDEAVLRGMRPDLDSAAAIRLWAQEQIDLRMKEMLAEDERAMSDDVVRTKSHQAAHDIYAIPDRDMTPEELYSAISDEIDYIYARG